MRKPIIHLIDSSIKQLICFHRQRRSNNSFPKISIPFRTERKRKRRREGEEKGERKGGLERLNTNRYDEPSIPPTTTQNNNNIKYKPRTSNSARILPIFSIIIFPTHPPFMTSLRVGGGRGRMRGIKENDLKRRSNWLILKRGREERERKGR